MGGVEQLDKAQPVGNTNKERAMESQDKAGEAVDGTFHPDNEDRLATLASRPAMRDKSVAYEQKERPLSKQSSKASGVFAGLAIVFSLIAFGVAGYVWYEFRLKQADTASENVALLRDIESQQGQINTLLGEIASLQSQVQSAQSETSSIRASGNELGDRMAAVEGQVAELTGAQRIDWMLKEVEHFVMVAERRLSLLGDVDGATALMFEADQLVLRMAEPAARPLRTAIKDDLYALEQAGSAAIDIEGLFAQLSLLKKQVALLEPAAVRYEAAPNPEEETAAPALFGIEYMWFEVKS
ncbi:MAG: uroporphyrinogen-III C-methyltransferase, partial [Pseudomonadales bacterium]|nr:uroporphyrinogen-III C-methyltransferase [Pseudomonadales bacterium]